MDVHIEIVYLLSQGSLRFGEGCCEADKYLGSMCRFDCKKILKSNASLLCMVHNKWPGHKPRSQEEH